MRRLSLVLACVLLVTSACATAPPRPGAKLWHDGRLFIATGNTTAVYYQIGGGLADVITKYLPGYEARAEPTGASGENIQRVADGDMDIAFANGDTVADGVVGKGSFRQPQRVVALTRIYRNYVHLVVRNAAKITKLADLKDKRVSTSSPNSGTDVLAGRILVAGGLDPDRDITRLRISLPDTTKGMQAGTIDALFFTSGLPNPGLVDLLGGATSAGQYSILPLGADILQPLVAKYGPVYGTAKVPKAIYNQPADVETIVLFNMLIVSPDMPDQLAYDLLRVLFEHQDELKKVHPEGGNFDKRNGASTDPVPLHPGAARFFSGG